MHAGRGLIFYGEPGPDLFLSLASRELVLMGSEI